MEIRKNIKNHFFLFYLLTVAICFVLGYVLLVSLDMLIATMLMDYIFHIDIIHVETKESIWKTI